MDESIPIVMDGKTLDARRGETILEVARREGIFIPTLCHYPGTTNVGTCRMCVVEVEGMRTLVASCAMPVSPGMKIKTDTPRVREAQRLVLELLWSAGDHNCLTCEKNGECELQDLIYRFGIEKPRFELSPPKYEKEETSVMIARDLNKCILCGRCVRACNEIQVNEILDFSYRGSRAKVGPAFDTDYKSSECYFCGECVDACPVGAITFKPARFQGRPWETKKIKTTCPYCGVGCQMDIHVFQDKVVKVSGNHASGEPNFGSLCVKGRFGMEFLRHPDRLKTPLIRRKKGEALKEAIWEEALNFVTQRLREIKGKYGPDSIAGLASARATNEENYLFQKFMRAVIGTNNVDHCARL